MKKKPALATPGQVVLPLAAAALLAACDSYAATPDRTRSTPVRSGHPVAGKSALGSARNALPPDQPAVTSRSKRHSPTRA
ncbi:MAG: hypothetical protein ABJC33_02015 [Betaproteobacteria bacterium]